MFRISFKEAYEIRNESDYEDFYVVSETEARQQLDNAGEFLEAVEEYIGKQEI